VDIEAEYPELVELRVFDGIEALMLVLEVEDDARHADGDTWFLTTPDDYSPHLTVYFTYQPTTQTIRLEAVWADA
jgi:hypothetical protein